MKYSVVAPVFNEEENVAKLHGELIKVMNKLKADFEIIFVNDGSTDKTEKALKSLKPITIISFRKNFGQSSALDAGIKHAKGEVIITLDGDGQNDPADIPKLLEKLGEDCDVVCGWRYQRRDPFTKRFVSKGAQTLRGFLVKDGVHDAGCTLRVYKHDCFTDLDLYGEMHRMIPALLRWRGFKICEVKVNHRPRSCGETKYNWRRIVKGFIDMLQVWFWRKYESRPLYLFGTAGLVIVFVSTLLLLWLAYMRIFEAYRLSDRIWPLVGLGGLLTGIQLFIFGILADMIIKSQGSQSHYNIKEIIRK